MSYNKIIDSIESNLSDLKSMYEDLETENERLNREIVDRETHYDEELREKDEKIEELVTELQHA